MAVTNLRQDEVFKAVTDAWRDAISSLLVGYSAPFYILYSTKESENLPPNDPKNTPWVRSTLQITDGRTTSISNNIREVEGLLTLQIFANQDKENAAEKVVDIADYFKDKFNDHEGDVYLFNVRTITQRADSGFACARVMADVYWQEFKGQIVTSPEEQSPFTIVTDDIIIITDDLGSNLVGI